MITTNINKEDLSFTEDEIKDLETFDYCPDLSTEIDRYYCKNICPFRSTCVNKGSMFIEKIIGSHNTMSFLKPKHWYLKPINWMFAKCQNRFNAGLGCIDFRVYWNSKKESWEFAHGLISYYTEYNISEIIESLIQGGTKYIRIILERDGGEKNFIKLCSTLEKVYSKIIFLGGYRKSDWKHLYNFGNDNLPIHQWVGSMAKDARWYEKLIPRLYASRMNRKNMEENLKGGINLFDFL